MQIFSLIRLIYTIFCIFIELFSIFPIFLFNFTSELFKISKLNFHKELL